MIASRYSYALRHWTGLVLFLDDGRLELDTNIIEREIRPIALGRKNSLFAGSDGGGRHWAGRGRPGGERGDPGGAREARGVRAAGVAHRRARAYRLGLHQGPRSRAAAA